MLTVSCGYFIGCLHFESTFANLLSFAFHHHPVRPLTCRGGGHRGPGFRMDGKPLGSSDWSQAGLLRSPGPGPWAVMTLEGGMGLVCPGREVLTRSLSPVPGASHEVCMWRVSPLVPSGPLHGGVWKGKAAAWGGASPSGSPALLWSLPGVGMARRAQKCLSG